MNQRIIDYLNEKTGIWMAQATPGEIRELEGLWGDKVRLVRHLALYIKDPHSVSSHGPETTLMFYYRWARDRELKARQMHARRNEQKKPVNTTIPVVSVASVAPALPLKIERGGQEPAKWRSLKQLHLLAELLKTPSLNDRKPGKHLRKTLAKSVGLALNSVTKLIGVLIRKGWVQENDGGIFLTGTGRREIEKKLGKTSVFS